MNVIEIVSDTFRRDHLGCYGNNWVRTEHLDRFAEESSVFDRAYIASFPTIPHRRDIFTGRYTFIYAPWSPLSKDEIILSQLLRQAGYTTMLVTDTYHLIKDGYGFDRGFDGWLWIRGQEFDRYMTNPTNDSAERKRALGTQYLQNVSLHRFEEDYFVAQTMTAAAKWLELNHGQHEKFFLHVDTFDPHEPWDPPKRYAEMYDPEWGGGDIAGGAYVPGTERPRTSEVSGKDLKRLRALYAGEVTLVDRWVGMLLQKIEDLGLYDDTAVIFTSDHGTYLGDHGFVGKRHPLFEKVTRVPLMIRLPDSEGTKHKRLDALVQSPDLMPTVLDMAGVAPPPTVQAKSLMPMIRGEKKELREIAVSFSSYRNSFNETKLPLWITATSKEWTYLAARTDMPAVDELGKRMESDFLYHLPTDPDQTHNLYDEKKEVADELRTQMISSLKSMGATDEALKKWIPRNT